ncbi:hypothetical protein FKP32DRAFT_1147529 [Trametes sanguinea]|nr:hypothetical protein FKP32DRAFT_1147529 [Trametes sanguinea]
MSRNIRSHCPDNHRPRLAHHAQPGCAFPRLRTPEKALSEQERGLGYILGAGTTAAGVSTPSLRSTLSTAKAGMVCRSHSRRFCPCVMGGDDALMLRWPVSIRRPSLTIGCLLGSECAPSPPPGLRTSEPSCLGLWTVYMGLPCARCADSLNDPLA